MNRQTSRVPSGILGNSPTPQHRARRAISLGFVMAATTGLFVGGIGSTASAAPGDTSSDTTVANVGVSSTITLSALSEDFTLNGLPTDIVTGTGDVTMNVTTANIGGYSVTVQAATATLVATTPGNPDYIPIGNLKVRETAAGNSGAFTSLSATSPVTVHTQPTRSAATGDNLSNDYQVTIPFVADDTYHATLNYIATAL